MKQFARYVILIYLLPVVLVAILVSMRYSLTDKQLANAYREDIAGYNWVNKVDSVEGFVFGSSCLRYGVSASLLADSNSHWINFSMDARDPIELYLLLEKYYPIKKPKTIVVGLDPWIYAKNYYPYRNKIMYLDLNASESFLYMYKKKDPAVYTTKFKQLLGLLLPASNSSLPESDTIPVDYGSVKLTQVATNYNLVKNEDWFEINSLHWSELQFTYLRRIKEYCKANNIHLLFVITPKRNDYIEIANGPHNRDYHNEWWKKASRDIGNEKIKGRYSLLSGANQDSVFEEAYHLSYIGQVVFSKYLKENLLDSTAISGEKFPF